MRIANNEDIEAPPNLMPLIDMVFLLLIFFLVASSLSQEEREQNLQLPRTSKAAQPMSAAPQQLIINILHD
ncbi:MAG: biopolymer transporter ExbD, partial [Phycisphaerae bacterium]|nr:biopolymer transporter ExbD [Phycisphaerae bacterium]